MALDETRMFIGGLAQTVTNDSLMQHFGSYGAVEACVNMDKNTGRSKGFAFVHFDAAGGVQAALMAEHVLDGKLVECKPCLAKGASPAPAPRPSSAPARFAAPTGDVRDTYAAYASAPGATSSSVPASGAAPTQHKLFVGGLSQATTRESMEMYFNHFGPCECIVMLDQVTGRSRGFGFAVFQLMSHANAALRNNGGAPHMIDGKHVECKACEEARPRDFEPNFAPAFEPPTRQVPIRPLSFTPGPAAGHGADGHDAYRMFVGGLPRSCDDEKLAQFASQFGTVTESRVHMDAATGRNKGFGYVSFADAGSCEAAVGNSAHNFIDEKWIDVKRCEAKAGGGGGGFELPGNGAAKGGHDRRAGYGKASDAPRIGHDNSHAILRTSEVLKVVGPDHAEQIAGIVELMEDPSNLALVQNLLSAVGSVGASAVKNLARKGVGRLGPY